MTRAAAGRGLLTSRNSAALRAALYCRVSTEEQVQGYSLAAQERAGATFCSQHEWRLVARYCDEGLSARSADTGKRPDFARMIADAEVGHFDVIVVHRLDRFARNMLVALETFQRLERAGVAFVSICENLDFTTPMGKVMLANLLAFAQYYSDNLSLETKKGKQERKEQGLFNGWLPFGVAKGEDGIPVPHPTNHRGLVMAFELAAQGKTDREIAQGLNSA